MPLESVAETASAAPVHAQSMLPPAIYYIHPLLAGPLETWGGLLDRVATMGFDHVLTAPLWAAGPNGDLFLTADPDRIDSRLGGGKLGSLANVQALSVACERRGLSLLMDVVLDLAAPDAAMPADIFPSEPPGDRLDPRDMAAGAARADFTSGHAIAWWIERLGALSRAGVRGFRLLGLDRTHAAAVSAIAEGVHARTKSVLLGWTPGMSRQARAALNGAGLDHVASSLPWWDFTAEWLWDETEELASIGDVVATPEAPFGPRLATRCHDPALLDVFLHRAMGFAALSAGGWILPMGCEFAAARPMGAADTPDDMAAMREGAVLDLSARIAAWNAARAGLAGLRGPHLISAPGATVLAASYLDAPDARYAGKAAFVLTNTSLTQRGSIEARHLLAAIGSGLPRLSRAGHPDVIVGDTLTLQPGEALLLNGQVESRTQIAVAPLAKSAAAAARAPRIAIEAITPEVDHGRFPAKRVVGDIVVVEADVIVDGHDQLGVSLLWRRAEDAEWEQTRMRPLGNDRWRASFPVAALGLYVFTVEAWRDAFATFRDELAKKHAAGVDTRLELREGRLLAAAAPELAASLDALGEDDRRTLLLSPEAAARMAEIDKRPFAIRREPPLTIAVDRPGAAFASWYEIFPRSMSDDPGRHGTFADVIRHLPRIRDMGFDVLYFPPIHPIGRINRKGRNNTLTPAPDDPGSPYAIGASEGGHMSLHPQLGTFDDFRRLREAAEAHGLELAIDFAVQCAPDHPWLKEHKDWFAWRPDGSLRYAENPPKKYEDIVNVDFYAPGAVPALWEALCETVLFWAGHGVRLFRVDNPHTKPLPFWEWLIAEVRARFPDAVFLAEAFTRPKVMTRLAKVGFGQSYTYFTWRNTKRELTEYLTELSAPVPREVFRPHFFVNTPDINPVFVHDSGRPGFLIRAALAATLSGLWGMYCGFELCEAARMPGKEEYLDSEKYQLRAWDWDRPGNIVAEVTQLNRIRRMNPALRTHLDVQFFEAFNDSILYFAKSTPDGSNCLLIAISLDPRSAQEADFELPLWEWGLPDTGALLVEDLVRGTSGVWRGKMQRMRLEPSQPYAIWRARPAI